MANIQLKKKHIAFLIFGAIIFIAFGIFMAIKMYQYMFPQWEEDVKDMSMEYLLSDEKIIETYGKDVKGHKNGMQYNTKTRNSTVYIRIEKDYYAVKIDCVNEEFIIRGYEKTEKPSF